MKKINNIKNFGEFNENLNISDVRNRLNESYNSSNYNTIVQEDILSIIDFFLEDLYQYNEENDITMNDNEIQKCIDLFKEDYVKKDDYYSEKEHYEKIVLDSKLQSDDYFNDIINRSINK